MMKPQLTLEDVKKAYEDGQKILPAGIFLTGGEMLSSEDYIKKFTEDVHQPEGLDVLQIINNYAEYTAQLEPCPFCTNEVIRLLPQQFGFSIHCDRCGAKKEYHGKEIDGAVFEWNNRRGESFQLRVSSWTVNCFGGEIAGDRTERNHRFLEEALELVQSLGASKGEAHQLVDYVFGRDIGEPMQELGGVMVTLAALCNAYKKMDMSIAGERELERCWHNIEKIREKQKNKPKHSPLPE